MIIKDKQCLKRSGQDERSRFKKLKYKSKEGKKTIKEMKKRNIEIREMEDDDKEGKIGKL